MPSLVVGVDIGGSFTDCVVLDRRGGLTRQVSHTTRMADGVGRFNVGEISYRLKCSVELRIGQVHPQGWLRRDHGVPATDLVQAREQRCRLAGEDVHDMRVELRPASLPGNRDRGVRSTDTVKDSSPLAPFGSPFPSQRSKVCSTQSRTAWPRPSRAIRASTARQ